LIRCVLEYKRIGHILGRRDAQWVGSRPILHIVRRDRGRGALSLGLAGCRSILRSIIDEGPSLYLRSAFRSTLPELGIEEDDFSIDDAWVEAACGELGSDVGLGLQGNVFCDGNECSEGTLGATSRL
jgi:hypothetical protein